MMLAMPALAVVFFSVLAFWKENALVFMLAGGVSMMTGLYWYDVYTNSIGLSVSLVLIAYSLVCFGFALRCIFWKKYRNEDEE